ncbi:MAG: PotD/PotF family extracellular solute-binding protein [Thermomicrobiales bacterium]
MSAQDSPPLRILGWGHYFSPSITQRFRDQMGMEIEVTPIGSIDDVVLFLRSGGIALYDLVAPTSGLVARMADEGLIQPFDDLAIPSLSGLFEPFRTGQWAVDGDRRLAVPVLWGSLAAVVPESLVEAAPAAWLDLMEEPYAKQVLMSDDPLGHFWIWNQAMGAADPTRVTLEELTATTDLLIQMKRNQATSWDGSIFAAMRRLARGRGTVGSVGWQSAPVLTEPGERSLRVFHPDPGDASFCDNLALVSEAPNPEAALAFMEYMITPETQADLMNETSWATVTEGAVPLLRPEIAGLLDYSNLAAHLERSPIWGYPPFTDEGAGISTYFDWLVAWDRIRATPVGG